MFIIYLHTKFHISSFNDLYKCCTNESGMKVFTQVQCSYILLKVILRKVAYFSKPYLHTLSRGSALRGINIAPTL
jgi:hypothetical protein